MMNNRKIFDIIENELAKLDDGMEISIPFLYVNDKHKIVKCVLKGRVLPPSKI